MPGHTIAVLFVLQATFYALKEVIGSGTMPSSLCEEKNAENARANHSPLGYDIVFLRGVRFLYYILPFVCQLSERVHFTALG